MLSWSQPSQLNTQLTVRLKMMLYVTATNVQLRFTKIVRLLTLSFCHFKQRDDIKDRCRLRKRLKQSIYGHIRNLCASDHMRCTQGQKTKKDWWHHSWHRAPRAFHIAVHTLSSSNKRHGVRKKDCLQYWVYWTSRARLRQLWHILHPGVPTRPKGVAI